MRSLIGALILLLLPASSFACYWDRDTLQHEGTVMPSVVEATVGYFPRDPNLFYQMRIDRELKEVARTPENLDLYDDLAVAYDRLGNDYEAARWIEAKRVQMGGDLSRAKTVHGKRDAFSEAAYRYCANAGTIALVRWMRGGNNASDGEYLRRSRHLIARAIAINPDAHFGREAVQLKLIDWFLDCAGTPSSLPFSQYCDAHEKGHRSREDRSKNVTGLVGMITMGAAWESPDVFWAMSSELRGRRNELGKLSTFVQMREIELLDQNKYALVDRDTNYNKVASWEKTQFERLRKDADRSQEERTQFMLAKLKQGLHPDTDPKFWGGFNPSPPLKLQADPLDYSDPTVVLKLLVGSLLLIWALFGLSKVKSLNRPLFRRHA